MAKTNREILTGGGKYRQKQVQRFGVEEVVFDKDQRKEYLTGFHKRKVERQKKAKKFHEEQERLAKIEERKQEREARKREFEERLLGMKEAKNIDLSEILKQETSDDSTDQKKTKKGDKKTAAKYKAQDKSGDAVNDSLDDWRGFEEDENLEPLKGILQRKEIYKLDNPLALGDAVADEETTVTIELLENPLLANVGHSSLDIIARSNNVILNKSEEILEKSIERAKKYAVVCGVAKPQVKTKKKKFRYLTKTERRDNNRKIKLKKLKSRNRD